MDFSGGLEDDMGNHHCADKGDTRKRTWSGSEIALIIIDMQNDFFPKVISGDCLHALIPPLQEAVHRCRESGATVGWVVSSYGQVSLEGHHSSLSHTIPFILCCRGSIPEQFVLCPKQFLFYLLDIPTAPLPLPPHAPADLPVNTPRLRGTHMGKRVLCQKGTKGWRIVPNVYKLADQSKDIFVEKTYYSAFTKTHLETALREKGVGKIYFAGITTNTCVVATACDAYLLGFEVGVLRDCTMSASLEKHDKAVETARYYGKIYTSYDMYLGKEQRVDGEEGEGSVGAAEKKIETDEEESEKKVGKREKVNEETKEKEEKKKGMERERKEEERVESRSEVYVGDTRLYLHLTSLPDLFHSIKEEVSWGRSHVFYHYFYLHWNVPMCRC